MFFWDKDSAHICGGVVFTVGDSTKCRHMPVDDNQELERKRTELRWIWWGRKLIMLRKD